MISIIEKLQEQDAIKIIYNLIAILNKGKNNPDEKIEFNVITENLTENQKTIVENILEEINFENINNDEILDQYIFELFNIMEKLTVSSRGLDISRGKNRIQQILNTGKIIK